MRRRLIPAVLLTTALTLTGCGGGEANKGTMPTPEGGGDAGTTTSATPSEQPTTETTSAPETTEPTTDPTTQTQPPPAQAQVIVAAGNFGSNPAVQGLVKSYPLYFQALVARDDKIVKDNFPAFFYADTSLGIQEAKRAGYVMRPPGSVVIVGVGSQPYSVVRIKTCRSQTTQYWDPKARRWVVTAPQGTPQAIDMVKTGMGWLPYRFGPSSGINCARVRYPA